MVNLRTYFDIINPKTFKETIKREAKVSDTQVTFVNAVLSSLISLLSLMILYSDRTLPTNLGSANLPPIYYKILTFNPVSSVAGIIISFFGTIILLYFGIGLLNLLAKALGGNGKFENLSYLFVMINVISLAIHTPINILMGFLPIAGCILSIVSLVLSIYIIYLYYKALIEVHNSLSRLRAIVALLIYLISTMVMGGLYLFIRVSAGI